MSAFKILVLSKESAQRTQASNLQGTKCSEPSVSTLPLMGSISSHCVVPCLGAHQSSTWRLLSTNSAEATKELFYLNLRFVGVGFRGYIIKKMIPVGQLSDEKKKLASRWIVTSTHDGSSSIRILILKLGQSAMTAYPIPANVNIYCPTDQQQQAENQPLLLTSTNYKLLTDVVSEIKSYKVPDVYKGSGVFVCERIETEKGEQYLNETILRKVIKKK